MNSFVAGKFSLGLVVLDCGGEGEVALWHRLHLQFDFHGQCPEKRKFFPHSVLVVMVEVVYLILIFHTTIYELAHEPLVSINLCPSKIGMSTECGYIWI